MNTSLTLSIKSGECMFNSHKGRNHTCQFPQWVQPQQTIMHCSQGTFWFEYVLYFSAVYYSLSAVCIYNLLQNETDTLRVAYCHFGKCRKSQAVTGVSEAGFEHWMQYTEITCWMQCWKTWLAFLLQMNINTPEQIISEVKTSLATCMWTPIIVFVDNTTYC